MVDKAIVEFARVVEEQHVLPGSPFDGGDSMLRDRVSVLGFAGNAIGGRMFAFVTHPHHTIVGDRRTLSSAAAQALEPKSPHEWPSGTGEHCSTQQEWGKKVS